MSKEAPQRWRPQVLLDGPSRKTLHDEEIAVQQMVDERVKTLFRQYGLNDVEDLFSGLKTLRELDDPERCEKLDESFARILREEGYDALPQLGQEHFDAIYELPDNIQKLIGAGVDAKKLFEMRTYAQGMQNLLLERIRDAQIEHRANEAHRERTGFAVFEIMAEIRREMLLMLTDANACVSESISRLNQVLGP
jgi:hypothetical protein